MAAGRGVDLCGPKQTPASQLWAATCVTATQPVAHPMAAAPAPAAAPTSASAATPAKPHAPQTAQPLTPAAIEPLAPPSKPAAIAQAAIAQAAIVQAAIAQAAQPIPTAAAACSAGHPAQPVAA